jgi:hypothetical protein
MKPGSLVRFYRLGKIRTGLVIEAGVGDWGDLLRILCDGKVELVSDDSVSEVLDEEG